ncbi:MAG: peptidylprolyl isomerase [Geothrix sp.]|nr:peptidylprolyl isomerase [Acidobacteriota bacterium]
MIRPLLSSLLLALALPVLAQAPQPAPAAKPAPTAKPRVQLMTSYGPVVVELEAQATPQTVANFLKYVQDGFYAGTIFHRVIDGFMIQGGGFLESMAEKPARAAIANEAPAGAKAGLKNLRGTIAMARTNEPHSAMAQFFINLVDNPRLDNRDLTEAGYGYCVFGRVVSGMDAVDRIGKVKTEWRRGMGDIPQFPVRLKEATVVSAP